MKRDVTVILPIKNAHMWQERMTDCALETLRCTTERPFKIHVVETAASAAAKPVFKLHPLIDRHHFIPWGMSKGQTHDVNLGLEGVDTSHVVYSGNDVFTRPGWLERLHQTFDTHEDCGIATLASGDLKMQVQDVIVEGVYGPFMMFESHWRYDAKYFPQLFADTDMIMRIYRSGKRSYRNFRCVIQHLNQQTAPVTGEDPAYKAAKQLFYDRHLSSGLLVFRLLYEGHVF